MINDKSHFFLNKCRKSSIALDHISGMSLAVALHILSKCRSAKPVRMMFSVMLPLTSNGHPGPAKLFGNSWEQGFENEVTRVVALT